jgi:hypothetical protein
MRIFLSKLIVRVVIPALAFPLLGMAGTSHGTAVGGPIPAGAFVTSGVVTSDIVLTDPGYVASGNAVTVNLLGLQHDFAGDLQITLSYIDANGNTVQSVDLINRIGATSANPYGTSADFGDDDDSGDNYQFNTDYSGNLWTVANCSDPPNCTTPYGDADSLPGVSTDTINNGQYFPSTSGGAKTNLSYAFAGLPLSGGDMASDDQGLGGPECRILHRLGNLCHNGADPNRRLQQRVLCWERQRDARDVDRDIRG